MIIRIINRKENAVGDLGILFLIVKPTSTYSPPGILTG
jgi:hypothetical protein